MQARFDRLFRNPQALRRLRAAQFLDIAQHEHGLVNRRKLPNGVFDRRAYLQLVGGTLGVILALHVIRHLPGALPPPQPSQRLVYRDLRQPRGELRLSGELVEVYESAHVGLLHRVLGFRFVLQDRPRSAI